LPDGSTIPIETRGAAEVTGFGGQRWAPAGIHVENPAFDVTPADLIDALITERGVIERPDRASVAALLRDQAMSTGVPAGTRSNRSTIS
jgi:methylthioribose-1-phosphate isomerase